MGIRPLRQRKKNTNGQAGATRAAGPKPSGRKFATATVSVDELLATKKAATDLGGTERALQTIQALKRLGGYTGRPMAEPWDLNHPRRWAFGGRMLGIGVTSIARKLGKRVMLER